RIPFAAGHTRRMHRLTAGPFHYNRYADAYLDIAKRYAHRPVKQAVISASALSLMYPDEKIPGYSREQFIAGMYANALAVLRGESRQRKIVQIDKTVEKTPRGIELDRQPTFCEVDLNLVRALLEAAPNLGLVLAQKIIAGGDRDSTHSADVDYAELLPSLFELKAGNFYIALAREKDRARALKIIRDYMKPDQRIFIGVVDPIDPRIETPEEIRDRIL